MANPSRGFANLPIKLTIKTVSGSVIYSNRELSTATLKTTATEAIQEFAETMLAALDESRQLRRSSQLAIALTQNKTREDC